MTRPVNSRTVFLLSLLLVTLIGVISIAGISMAQSNLTVYDEALASGWQNWSWDTTANFGATSPVHGGSKALAVTYNAGWAGLYLRSLGALPTGYDTLRFWIHGGASGGQPITVAFYDQGSNGTNVGSVTPLAGQWLQVDVSLSGFGTSDQLWGIVLQNNSASAKPTFTVDDIQLIGQSGGGTPTPLALHIDAAADQHAISPYIYGMNFASSALAADIDLPANRWGGNTTTRYNWQIDSANHGSDWFFENIPNDPVSVALLPNGSTADQFIEGNEATNTESLITMPMIGWTPKDRTYAACGFAVSLYGTQQQTDPWWSNCGNGIKPDGTFVTGNNPNDIAIPVDQTFDAAWVAHLQSQFGTAASGGVRFYELDNEPSIWHSTHRDIRPQPLGSVELRDRTITYGSAIKAADSGALLLGPEEYGWTGYFFSGVDQASGQWSNPPEKTLRGGLDLIPWYLDQLHQYQQTHGTRLLDYLSLHYYPSQDGVTLGSAGDTATQALRLRSTRSLWDPTYVDESWIGTAVRLIPRMHDWVNTYYPGTKLAITEYNWGGFEHINGALAEADVLGIFGRESLDLATLWTAPDFDQPVAYAFRMYRNYDGSGSKFGETNVRAQSTDQAQLSVYAALRSDGALTAIVINKTGGSLTAPIQIDNFSTTTAQVYRYSGADLTHITHQPNLTVSGGSVSTSFPANSITMLVFTPSASANLQGHVALTGRPMSGQSLNVDFYQSGVLASNHSAVLDAGGAFLVSGITPGTYRVRVKHPQQLSNAINLTFPLASPPADFGTLHTGDANNDNAITIADFSILAATFGKASADAGYDARADFNGDNAVTIADFALLAAYFGSAGVT